MGISVLFKEIEIVRRSRTGKLNENETNGERRTSLYSEMPSTCTLIFVFSPAAKRKIARPLLIYLFFSFSFCFDLVWFVSGLGVHLLMQRMVIWLFSTIYKVDAFYKPILVWSLRERKNENFSSSNTYSEGERKKWKL